MRKNSEEKTTEVEALHDVGSEQVENQEFTKKTEKLKTQLEDEVNFLIIFSPK